MKQDENFTVVSLEIDLRFRLQKVVITRSTGHFGSIFLFTPRLDCSTNLKSFMSLILLNSDDLSPSRLSL